MKVKLSEIQVTKLNGTCLTLISQFSRALKAYDGTVLHLTNPGILGQVIEHTKKADSPELTRLCNMLIVEIRTHLSGKSVEHSNFPLYQKLDESSSEQLPKE